MATPRAKKMQKCGGSQSGGVTENSTISITPHLLPHDLIENIFTFLPLKEATIYAVLSPRFKNSWKFSRNLYFDQDFAKGKPRYDFVRIVDRVLKLHSGDKIQRFKLYFDHTQLEVLVKSWLKKVTMKGVEEMDLDFNEAKQAFKLSYELVDLDSLISLKLNFCYLDLPQNLEGLSFLKTLVLHKVEVRPILTKTLFSNCSVLEILELVKCSKIYHLDIYANKLKNLTMGDCRDVFDMIIDAPTLNSLQYRGDGCKINFKSKMLNLSNVILNFVPSRRFPKLIDISSLIVGLSVVDVLTVSGTFLEGLSQRYIDGSLREPQFQLYNVKEFHFFMEGFSYTNPYDIACFIKNCPHLEKLFIDFGEANFECGYYWELQARHKFELCSPTFSWLRSVKLMGFKFQRLEFSIVKLLLEKARFLDSLDIITSKNDEVRKYHAQDSSVYDHYFLSWKVSPYARVHVYDYRNDKSSIHPHHPKKWSC